MQYFERGKISYRGLHYVYVSFSRFPNSEFNDDLCILTAFVVIRILVVLAPEISSRYLGIKFRVPKIPLTLAPPPSAQPSPTEHLRHQAKDVPVFHSGGYAKSRKHINLCRARDPSLTNSGISAGMATIPSCIRRILNLGALLEQSR